MMFKISSVLFLISVCFSNLARGYDITYAVHADIDPENKVLHGTATITTDSDIKASISGLDNVTLNERFLNKKAQDEEIELKAGQTYKISYQYVLNSNSNYSDNKNILLSGNWYPYIRPLAKYQLSVTLPKGFQAISEADQIEIDDSDEKQDTYKFIFPYPLDNLTLAASSEYQIKQIDYEGIVIRTWFKEGNSGLADTYLQHAADYFKLYQTLLGPYPYKHFTMVESPVASGQSMPGYTLLGSRVIALPFIVKTSLGHEILHQWFGNSVYVDYQHGNWCEGLTSYLSDHYYAERQGNGVEYRKNILSQYDAYVTSDKAFPVRKFSSRFDKTSSAIGYGKVAMIFHQLRGYYGDEQFFKTLRSFIKKNTFNKASWHDIQAEFESINGDSLYEDFSNWLSRQDIAAIRIKKGAEMEISQGKLWLKFTLEQDHPYHLHLPMRLSFENNINVTKILHFTKAVQDFRIELEQPPVRVDIDPEYAVMRHLSDAEKYPQLAWLLSRDKVMVATDKQHKGKYSPVIRGLGFKETETISPDKITYEMIKHNSVILTEWDNPVAQMLFGKRKPVKNGVELTIKRNPYNEKEVIALLSSSDVEQAQLVSRKLSHYGKYSHLMFNDGRLVSKVIADSVNGIELFKNTPAKVVRPSRLDSLDSIVSKVANSRFILIGEQHDRFEHHLNQLLLIKKLYNSGYKVVVGFEMFQQPYQSALDDYAAGKISEAEFLTASQYFDKWRFDYNLYKPVIDFAVKNNIPMQALNIDNDISRHVARTGMQTLSEEQQKQLPPELDFSNREYSTDLKAVFKFHKNMNAGKENSFDYFLQSQTLWDESMAQAAVKYMFDKPDHVMVILAGNGHFRKYYGIPDRIKRLSGENPLVLVQDESLEKGIADYVLLTTPVKGASTPMIGIYVDTESKDKIVIKDLPDDSIAAKAGLRKGDILVTLDGKALRSFSDLKLSLLYADTSKPVSVTIKRDEKKLEKLLDFSTSKAPAMPFSHKK